MNEMQHTVTALTQTRLCVFRRDKVWSVYQNHPDLAFSMTWMAAREEQLLDSHLLSIGQRNALERASYLILHLYDRAAAVGYARKDTLQVPFGQSHFADALGITPVHLNRTLRKLRERGLVLWRDDGIVILDRRQLESVAKYERDERSRRPLI